MYKLYKITNKVNNKLYIGITKLTLAGRWKKHCKDSLTPKYPLHRAISKYGIENFTIELLVESDDRIYISNLEEPAIILFNTRAGGYNVATGGYGGDLGPIANNKRKITIANRSYEEKQRLSTLQSNRQAGKTKENNQGRRAQSEKIKGNTFRAGIPHAADTKKKISVANKGKTKSKTTRQRMANSAKINENEKRFAGRRASCLCCCKEWDIGNFTQHITRKKNVIQ